jgi:hypothetical protein
LKGSTKLGKRAERRKPKGGKLIAMGIKPTAIDIKVKICAY